MNLVYVVKGTLFTTREAALTSIKISYHSIAKQIVPNTIQNCCTVIFNDRRRKPVTVKVYTVFVHEVPQHL